MRKTLRNLKSGHVLRPRLAMVVLEPVKRPGGTPRRVWTLYLPYLPCTQLHSSQCWRHTRAVVDFSKILETKSPRFVSAVPPQRVQPLIGTAHVLLRCHSRKPPSAELRASWVACCALLCAVKAASCVYTHAAAMSHLMSLGHENLYCLVR